MKERMRKQLAESLVKQGTENENRQGESGGEAEERRNNSCVRRQASKMYKTTHIIFICSQLNYFNQYIQRIVKEMSRNQKTTTILYIAIEYNNSNN